MLEHVEFAVIRQVIFGVHIFDKFDVIVVVSVTGKVERSNIGGVSFVVLEDLRAFAE